MPTRRQTGLIDQGKWTTVASTLPIAQRDHLAYRPDIDGLRAIAVLAVVLYHAFPEQVHGGFVGVDVFFVISGFLISTIVLKQLNQDRFSFAEFYSRRIRRIFPALLVTLACIFGVSWLVLLPTEFKQFGWHMAGSAGFASNFFYWLESGYFDSAADTKPLLHLWSLGVEEQFYIIWPLLLWIAWRKKLNIWIVMTALASASLLFSLLNLSHDPLAAFYLPHSRFWELMIGALLAYFVMRRPPLARKGVRDLCAATGGVLIAVGIFTIAKTDLFPGWKALIPTLGSALVILAGPGAWLNRTVLSRSWLVWLGLISYPLYLWHWPLLTIPRIVLGEVPPQSVRLIVLAVAVALALATYLLVEKPVRRGGQVATRVALWLMLVAGVTGYFTYLSNGLPSRTVSKSVLEGDITEMAYHEYATKQFFPCTPLHLRTEEASLVFGRLPRCLQSKANGPIDVAIIGDSHAEHLFPGLAEALPDKNIVVYIKTTLPVSSDPEFREIYKYVLTDDNIKVVVISAFWLGKQAMVTAGTSFSRELARTVDALEQAHKFVYIADDVPKFAFDPERCKYMRRFGQPTVCTGQSESEVRRTYLSTLESIERAHSNVRLLRTSAYFCDSQTCDMSRNGEISYRDRDHLNILGSRYLAERIIADKSGSKLIDVSADLPPLTEDQVNARSQSTACDVSKLNNGACDVPVVGDWTATGKLRIGVFRQGLWYLDEKGNHELLQSKPIGWGKPGDTPVVGDWNGDGKTKIGVYHDGLWFLDYDGSHKLTATNRKRNIIRWGQPGDLPIVGDWNRDGRTKIGVVHNGVRTLDVDGSHRLKPPSQIQPVIK